MDDQNKNLILATVLSFLVILTWFWLFPPEDLTTPNGSETVISQDDGTVPTAGADTAVATTAAPTDAPVVDAPRIPVTLVWDNGAGLIFRNAISVDEEFMFTFAQSVENTSGETIAARPYGLIRRHGEPSYLKNFFILHEGMVRMSDGELEETKYSKIVDYDVDAREGTQAERVDVTSNGWIGYTDHYWMTTLIPDQAQPFRSVSKYFASRDLYQAEAVMPVNTVAAGDTATVTTRLFAGAKEWEAIRNYENDENVTGFLDSIDWGWFFFLTKPIFWLLHTLNIYIGNMGWSIIALTVILKALVLPLAFKSHVSMAKMKELQPEMEKLKERTGDDKQAMQQGMMKLYKDNKVNPASGCLPILLQIPIFFSLYKVIFVTIELRHAEWFGWIRDLSAPDPSSILNLFGLFPSQKMIFAWMPWVFMFMLGTFARS